MLNISEPMSVEKDQTGDRETVGGFIDSLSPTSRHSKLAGTRKKTRKEKHKNNVGPKQQLPRHAGLQV